jgi:hypothetical protein
MDVLRHDNIAANNKAVPDSHHFQGTLKQAARRRRAEIRKTAITTEGQKMKTTALLKTDKPFRYPNILHPKSLLIRRKTAH